MRRYNYIYDIISIWKILLLFGALLSHSHLAFPSEKEPVYTQIVKGLPSSEVYDIYQDLNGKIWFATDRGIATYDGNTIKKIETQSKINTNLIFRFKEEHDKKVWVITGIDKIFWFNPDSNKFKLNPYLYNDTLAKVLRPDPFKLSINNIYFENGSLNATFLHTTKLTIDPQGNAKFLAPKHLANSRLKTHSLVIHDDRFFPYTEFDPTISNTHQIYWKAKGKSPILIVEHADYKQIKKINAVTQFERQDDYTILSIGRYLIKHHSNQFDVTALGSEILDFELHGHRIVVGTFNGIYELDHKMDIKGHYLKGHSISSILSDSEDGIWASTLGKGVFYIPKLDVRFLPISKKSVPKKLFVINGRLVSSNSSLTTIIYGKNQNTELQEVTVLANLFRSENRHLSEFLGQGFKDDRYDLYNYLPCNKSVNITAYGKRIRILESGKTKTLNTDSVPYILSYFTLSDTSTVLGTTSGLYLFQLPDKISKIELSAYDFSTEIRQIESIEDGFLYLTGEGIVWILNDKSVLLNKANGFQNNFFNGMHKANDSTIWFYGNSGIDKVIFNEYSYNTSPLLEYDLLPNQEISAMTTLKGKLFIGTRAGIYEVESSKISKHIELDPAKFFIDSIIDGDGIKKNHLENIKLDSDNDGLHLYFNYRQYNKKSILIEYRYGNSEQWIETNGNSIRLNKIPFGDHVIRFRAKHLNQTTELTSILFHVPTPLYKTIWFYPTLMLIVFILFFISYHNYRTKVQNRKNEKAKLELSLLSSRMNPHFTFNTISSIQAYIINNEKGQAVKYLSDFGQLMRKTLNYSYTDKILLSEEIKFLELLISLENKRFEEEYHLKIAKDQSITDFELPALILQPLVENVIKHCQFKNDAPKVIYIFVKDRIDYYEITVEDHGLQKAQSQQITEHHSYGLKITSERIRLYNGSTFSDSDFIAKRKTDNSGFKVTLKIKKQ